ncbi:MAG: hypothetical protein WCF67_20195 [Chitinophagaceae bacterium]
MKKLFALMLTLGVLTTAFAQSGSNRNERDDRYSNRDYSRGDIYRKNDTRDYPGSNRDDSWSKGNDRYGYPTQRNDNRSDGRYDSRYEERRRQEERDRINREYDRRIEDYRRDRSMNDYERQRRIDRDERERKEKLKSFAGGAVAGALAGVLIGILIGK